MIEEIITIDGNQFKLMTDYPLTAEQRSQTIGEIERQLGCTTCGGNRQLSGNISSLVPTCTATSKVVGQIVALKSVPTGPGPFTVAFKRDNVQIGTTQTVSPPTTTQAIYNYTTVAADATTGTPIGTHIFSVDTTGSCAGGTTCTESCTIAVTAGTLTTITVAAKSVMNKHKVTMTAVCKDQAAQTVVCPALTWSSSNPSVATIDANAYVMGVSVGTATITATSGTVIGSGTLTVTAQILGSIMLPSLSSPITVGSTVRFDVACMDNNIAPITMTCPTLTWSSSNTVVATVSATGLVTAVAPGTATITAASGTISGTSGVEVMCAPTGCGFSAT